MHRISNVQSLRALAALLVVMYHTGFRFGPLDTFGSFGVDIFFAISGFIMAMICAAEAEQFFAKRMIRVVPLYWAVTLFTFAGLRMHALLDPGLKRGFAELLKSLLFIPYERGDGKLLPILSVGWTLNCEVYFYVLLALGLTVTKRRPVLFASLLLLGLTGLTGLMPGTAPTRFFGDTVMLEFLGGIGAFQIYRALSTETCVRIRPGLLVSLGVCLAMLIYFETSGRELSLRGLRYGVPAVALLQGVVLLSKSGWDIHWKLPVLLGNASYSLYLTHLFVIATFKRVVSVHVPWLAVTRWPGLVTVMVVSAMAAVLVHRYVDRPIQIVLHKALRRRRLRQQDETMLVAS